MAEPKNTSKVAGVDYPLTYTSNADFVQSNWTISSAMKTNYNDTTRTNPKINYNFNYIDSSKVVFGTTPLRTLYSETCMYNGWFVMFSLIHDKASTAETTQTDWASKLSSSYIGFWYSKDGVNWQYGGKVLQASAFINPIISNFSATMREGTSNTVDIFYTSVVTNGTYMELCYTTGTIIANSNGVTFDGFSTSKVAMEADGIIYSTQQQNDTFMFASPYPFINPGDGKLYCLIESKLGGMISSFVITKKESGIMPPGYVVGKNASNGNSCIGIMEYTGDISTGDFSSNNWKLLDPLVSCLGVTAEFSRPHILFNGPYTYIFGSVQSSSFTGGLYSPTGLYGFYSETGLFGKYEPMNGSGFIVGNPTCAPAQSTSFLCDNKFNIFSTIVILPKDGAQDPNNPKVYRVGGTPTPTVQLSVSEDETFITNILNFGQVETDYIDWSTIYTTYSGNSSPLIRS